MIFWIFMGGKNMPKMTTAIVKENGETVNIDKALDWTDRGYLCFECKEPVKPFNASAYGAAHFEHEKRNSNCSLSDKR
ncbi:MAG: hypothetical protein ABSF52_04735 [Syntrophobacteraceae bacterium]